MYVIYEPHAGGIWGLRVSLVICAADFFGYSGTRTRSASPLDANKTNGFIWLLFLGSYFGVLYERRDSFVTYYSTEQAQTRGRKLSRAEEYIELLLILTGPGRSREDRSWRSWQ